MPGYDKSRIVGIDLDQLEEFSGGICQDVLNKPVVTQCCQQSYCKDCITRWLNTDQTCPNDRQPLTADGLSPVPRFVNNLIDNMKMKCQFHRRGCSVVLAISEMSKHSKNCDYSQCKTCGFSDPDNGHECVTQLLQDKLKLAEEVDMLKSANTLMNNLNTDLISSEKSLKEERKLLQTELAKYRKEASSLNRKIMQLQDELNKCNPQSSSATSKESVVNKRESLRPIPQAIMGAKEVTSVTVICKENISDELALLIKNICQIAIKDFDNTKHKITDFTSVVRGRIVEKSNRPDVHWIVYLHAGKERGNWSGTKLLYKLLFGNLIVVIGGQVKRLI